MIKIQERRESDRESQGKSGEKYDHTMLLSIDLLKTGWLKSEGEPTSAAGLWTIALTWIGRRGSGRRTTSSTSSSLTGVSRDSKKTGGTMRIPHKKF